MKPALEGNPQQIHHLLEIEDQQGKRVIELEDARCSIGRDSTNSVVLHSRLVSRQHAILLRITIPETASYLFRLVDDDFQGGRSTNGINVNGQRCFSHDLKHGDTIVFGKNVKARYYASSHLSDIKFLTSSKADDLSGLLPKLSQTLVAPDIKFENFTELALVRLASFPELLSDPIIEITLDGTITYLNPAAVVKFPVLREAQLQHPILASLLSIILSSKEKIFIREVEYSNQVFEQSIHYIAESDLVRSYVVDITRRKQVELALQKAHDELETRVVQRTAELSKHAGKVALESEVEVGSTFTVTLPLNK